jgi:Flp pilus assembly secretin CpaC
MRPALLLLAAGLALPAGFSLPARADTISVALDEVQTVTFPRNVATINVGNPAIADITPIDDRHAFVLGKAYGATNIIALNREGDVVSNTHVSVLNGQQSTVRLQQGTERITYNCVANNCEISPQPGDGKTSDAVAGQITAHQDAAKKAANPQSN